MSEDHVDGTVETLRHSVNLKPHLFQWKSSNSFCDVVKCCNERLHKDPNDWVALRSRALCLVHLQRYDAAVKDWSLLLHHCLGPEVIQANESQEKRTELMNSLVEAFFYRGFCLEKLNMLEDAICDLTEALTLNPQMSRAAYERAACFSRLGRLEEAIEDFERALSTDRKSLSSLGGDIHFSSRVVGRLPLEIQEAVTSEMVQRSCGGAYDAAREKKSASEPQATLSLCNKECCDLLRAADTKIGVNGWPLYLDASVGVSPNHLEVQDHGPVEVQQDHFLDAGGNQPCPPDEVYGARSQECFTPGVSCTHSVSKLSTAASDKIAVESSSSSFLGDGSSKVKIEGNCCAATEFYKKGVKLRQQGEMSAAISMFTRAVEIDAHYVRAFFNRAYCLDKIGETEKAIKDYEYTLTLDSLNPFVFYNLGILYDHTNQLSKAIQMFSRAIDISPHYPDFFHNRGLTERRLGNFGAAIENYTSAITLQPDHFKALFNRGFCFDRLEDYAHAVQDYTSAICVQRNHPCAYHNRGAAYDKLGLLEEAIQDFTQAIQLNPSAVYSYNARGLCFHKQKDYTSSLCDFNRCIELDGNNPTFYHNRGFCYRYMNRFHESLADYTTSLRLCNDNLLTHNNRAFILRKLEQYEEAIEEYSFVLANCPSPLKVKMLNNRAYCHARLGNFEAAIQDFSGTLYENPHNTNARYNRAVCYEKLKCYDNAFNDYSILIEDSLSGEDDVANALMRRGTIYLRSNNIEAAKKDFFKCIVIGGASQKERKGDEAVLRDSSFQHPAVKLLKKIEEIEHCEK